MPNSPPIPARKRQDFDIEVLITGRRANAVLISEEDWRAVQEKLYLLSIPGMRESIRKGLATPIDACAKELRC
jgi:PHD/YefM family antitoxin component YafN of YafNO toxin-antitoxin module